VRISPQLGGRYWLDFSTINEVIAAGAEAAREAITAIRVALSESRLEAQALSSLDPRRVDC
jgi:hypothetical protein